MSFSFPVRIYWEDTDAGGIVYHANYLRFFERARTEWLRALGLGQSDLAAQTGGIFVAADAHLKFIRPARLDDELRISATLQSAGTASLVLAQQAWIQPRPATGGAETLACEATVRIGWVGAHNLRPARIPPDILQALTS